MTKLYYIPFKSKEIYGLKNLLKEEMTAHFDKRKDRRSLSIMMSLLQKFEDPKLTDSLQTSEVDDGYEDLIQLENQLADERAYERRMLRKRFLDEGDDDD